MRLVPFAPALILFLISLTAHADTFNFDAEGSAGGFSGSGTLTATANGDGSYTITGITGPGVTGLIPSGQFALNDNQLYPDGNGLLDDEGLSFTDVMDEASYDVNIYYSSLFNSYLAIVQDADGTDEFLPTNFTISAVTPEPSAIALLGTGMLGVAGLVRKRLGKRALLR